MQKNNKEININNKLQKNKTLNIEKKTYVNFKELRKKYDFDKGKAVLAIKIVIDLLKKKGL
jgi:hypothetical protein